MASHKDKRGLFDFMLERIKETQYQTGLDEPQAFSRWFLNMYFRNPQDVFISDGSHDGKVDAFFTTHNGATVEHHVLNAKFTHEYNKLAPVAFYDEITCFWRVFDNKNSREDYLERAVKAELRPKYRQLLERYDAGTAHLMFVTNHRRNEAYYGQVERLPVEIFHLDDLLQHLIDDLDVAMPRTPPLTLTGIHSVSSPSEEDTEVHTSIVFARLIGFIKYMQNDPHDLLFMRNVRVAISPAKSLVNRAIRSTFRDHPKEFASSNNGITLLCEQQVYHAGVKELKIDNPRVVNGSQTLHSIRDVPNPSPDARVMVRIIEIPAPKGDDLPEKIQLRKDVISKIAIRSNQQNPIKNWDLVSNDDFQLDLYRHFRQRDRFYERREREWRQRSRELKSVGIMHGLSIKRMTQLIASYYWNRKKLGPATAKHSLGELFEGEAYDLVRQTPPELAYQIYMAGENLDECLKDLASSKRYIEYLKRHIDLTLFAVVTKALQSAGGEWSKPEFTQLLEQQWKAWWDYDVRWRQLTKACIDHIFIFYQKEAQAVYKAEGKKPTYVNYFKNQTYIAKITSAPIPNQLKKLAHEVLML